MKIEFDCFLPEFEQREMKDGKGVFQKSFLKVDGFSFGLSDFDCVVELSGVKVGQPCTIIGNLKKSDYNGKSYNSVVISEIIPYGGGEKNGKKKV